MTARPALRGGRCLTPAPSVVPMGWNRDGALAVLLLAMGLLMIMNLHGAVAQLSVGYYPLAVSLVNNSYCGAGSGRSPSSGRSACRSSAVCRLALHLIVASRPLSPPCVPQALCFWLGYVGTFSTWPCDTDPTLNPDAVYTFPLGYGAWLGSATAVRSPQLTVSIVVHLRALRARPRCTSAAAKDP